MSTDQPQGMVVPRGYLEHVLGVLEYAIQDEADETGDFHLALEQTKAHLASAPPPSASADVWNRRATQPSTEGVVMPRAIVAEYAELARHQSVALVTLDQEVERLRAIEVAARIVDEEFDPDDPKARPVATALLDLRRALHGEPD